MSGKSAVRRPAPRVSDLFSEVLKYVRATLEPGTFAIYSTTFDHFRRSAGNPPIPSLTPRDIDKYKIERLAAVAPATVNIELRTLKSAFRMGIRWNMLRKSPCEGVSLARIPEREPPYYVQEEFQKLLDTIREPWLRDVVLFAAVTGMRQGEILSLRWDQVDFQARVARLSSSASFKTKTGKRRSVPLGDTAIQVLRAREAGHGSGIIFTLRGRPLMRRWVTTKLRRYVREIGLDRRLNFHSLRASFASWLALDGVSIYQISKLLGHSDVKITQEYYAHLEPTELHDVVDRITFPFRRPPLDNTKKESPLRERWAQKDPCL
jgi:integrase